MRYIIYSGNQIKILILKLNVTYKNNGPCFNSKYKMQEEGILNNLDWRIT